MNSKFFDIFVSIPYQLKMCDKKMIVKQRSRRQLIYWFLVSILGQLIIGLHILAYVVHTFTGFDTLTNLRIQRTFAFTVLGSILFLSFLVNLFFATHYNECEFFVREGLRIDVDMTGKSSLLIN